MHAIDFRINRPIPHDAAEIVGVRYRAGFEDWDRPDAFVIQMEEAKGFDADRGSTDWSPIARFEHLRPHDVFEPSEGLHLDVYRRADPLHEYQTVDFDASPAKRNPKAVFFSLLRVFETETNIEILLRYYLGRESVIHPKAIVLPEGLVS